MQSLANFLYLKVALDPLRHKVALDPLRQLKLQGMLSYLLKNGIT